MPNPVSEYAASQARYLCVTTDHGGVGYSQPNRWTAYEACDWAGWLKGPGETDCSALVAGCYNHGFHERLKEDERPAYFPRSTWTGSLKAECLARGFADIGDSWTGNTPDGGFQVGDLLLLEPGHVAMCVRDTPGGAFNPDNPMVAEAWIDRVDDIMGAAGDDGSPADDTGGETRLIRYLDHPYTQAAKWSTCLRYTGATSSAPASGIATRAVPISSQAATTSTHEGLTWGVDVSMHQNAGAFPADAECVIIKATEGVGYEDPTWKAHAKAAWDSGKLVGFYHFARPDLGNTAEAEAEWFLSVVKDWLGYAVLVLDWEREPLNDVGWARRFLDKVWYGSPTRPWVYMNLSTARSHAWESVSEHYPLWMASYDGRAWDDLSGPHPGHGWRLIGKQYTEDPIDKNTFYFPPSNWKAAIKGRSWPNTTTSEEEEFMSIKDELVNTWLDPLWKKLVEINTRVQALSSAVDELKKRLDKEVK